MHSACKGKMPLHKYEKLYLNSYVEMSKGKVDEYYGIYRPKHWMIKSNCPHFHEAKAQIVWQLKHDLKVNLEEKG